MSSPRGGAASEVADAVRASLRLGLAELEGKVVGARAIVRVAHCHEAVDEGRLPARELLKLGFKLPALAQKSDLVRTEVTWSKQPPVWGVPLSAPTA